jgi:N-acetylglucosamine malate deacetylase 1
MLKLDILVLAAHPDDAELGCSGTIASQVAKGNQVGIVDLTHGEMGTRGTPELSFKKLIHAAQILGLAARENMGFKDVFFQDDAEHQLKLVQVIRKYQPEIVLANAVSPIVIQIMVKGSSLATNACFMSGLTKIETLE